MKKKREKVIAPKLTGDAVDNPAIRQNMLNSAKEMASTSPTVVRSTETPPSRNPSTFTNLRFHQSAKSFGHRKTKDPTRLRK